MDSVRFDALVRRIGGAVTRRGALVALLAGLAIPALPGAAPLDQAAAAKRGRGNGKGKRRDGSGKGKNKDRRKDRGQAKGKDRKRRVRAEQLPANCCSTNNCTPGPGKNLGKCCYEDANLAGQSFKGANLGSANFSGATLTNANFTGANLGKTCFVDAILTGANLAGTNTSTAIFCRTQTDSGENNSGCGKGTPCCPTCDDENPCDPGEACCKGRCRPSVWANQTTFGTGPGSGNNQFSTPQGLTVPADGLTTLVADRNNSRISVWTRPDATSTNWSPHSTFGSFGSGANQFSFPRDVALSADELTAWVGDLGNNRVSVWTRPSATSINWSHQTNFGSAGNGDNQFNLPRGVAVSQDTLTVWVVDQGNDRISIWTRPNATSINWSPLFRFGSTGNGANQFSFPRDIALSADELTVLVADGGNHRISVWTRPNATSTDWNPHSTFGTGPGNGDNQFNIPHDVAVAADELTAWVADELNDRISIWTRPNATSANWSPLDRFGTGPGNGDNEFNGPRGVAVAADELTVWVGDALNDRVSVWALGCPV